MRQRACERDDQKHFLRNTISLQYPLGFKRRTHPMLESTVVAKVRNDVGEYAMRSKVCPPESNRVKKGNFGGSGVVSRGVKACACYVFD